MLHNAHHKIYKLMIHRILHSMKKMLFCLADLIMPRKCIVCDEKLALEERHLCRWCLSDMPLTRFWQLRHNRMADKFNEVVQKQLEEKWETEGVTSGLHERYSYAAALFFFNDEADYKRIPYSIKYEGNTSAGKHFGKILGEHLSGAEWFGDIDAIIPVPLHWLRRWKRGYNQAEIIAQGISAVLEKPVRTDILKRKKQTKTQTQLSIREKSRNVAGAFTATADSDEEFRHILLVDDVFTTGSTLLACFTALREVFPPNVRISVATLGFVGN